MTVEKPTVSVVIPTYNREKVLGRAIHSVLNQTFEDIELIVVDDCSIDGTKELIDGLEDPRVMYIRLETNQGSAAARNTGINAARGEFIAFQDSDAEWMPDKLEKQMNVFFSAKNDVNVVYTAFLWIKDNYKSYIPAKGQVHKDGDVFHQLLKRNFVDTATAVVKKKCFEKVGMFDERLPRYQDWDLFIRLSKHYHFKFVDEPLLISHFMPDSISADNKAAITARKIIFEKNRSEIIKDRKLLSQFMFDTGTLICKYGRFDEGREYLSRAFKADHMNPQHWPATLVSLFGQKVYIAASRITSRI